MAYIQKNNPFKKRSDLRAAKNKTNKQIPIKIKNAEALTRKTITFSKPSLPNKRIIIIIIKRIITIDILLKLFTFLVFFYGLRTSHIFN